MSDPLTLTFHVKPIDRCKQCARRRDVHTMNWFSRRHPFVEAWGKAR